MTSHERLVHKIHAKKKHHNRHPDPNSNRLHPTARRGVNAVAGGRGFQRRAAPRYQGSGNKNAGA